ncbi:MAG: aminoacyl-histidine dipeptidase [Eubacteriales bacterium]|nr:aminoacyl-histidine dipeptidase [Eubacteriales bacterium]
MERLQNSEAKEVFSWFLKLCAIPHGSGNIRQISDFLADFARERGLDYVQDKTGNVIIKKGASAGYEQEPTLILQGHMDMVAVKKPGCAKDMAKEGLDVKTDGDWLYAQDTSLGGDDGIAVAYMLSVLDDSSLAHPAIEAVFTVDEETGMDGAREIDLGFCAGKRLLNLDSEEEGIFLTSCAGGARLHGFLPAEWETLEGCLYRLSVGGLQGGHSGAEINKERGNSNCLAGRLLYEARKAADVRPVSMEGGLADNAIPRQTHIGLFVTERESGAFEKALASFEDEVKKELAVKDPGFCVELLERRQGAFCVLTRDCAQKAAFLLLTLPNGVQSMSADIPGLVQTSLNLGILRLDREGMQLDYSVRSSVGSEKELLLDKAEALLKSQGASWELSGAYPAWEYRQDSPLRGKMVQVYQHLYHEMPRIEAIHAGLECGILAGKIPGLDCVSIGPDMRDIHTTEERLSIPSVERVWNYLQAVLAQKD